MLAYIYHITNKLNGKKYIGYSNNVEHRLEQHYSALKKGKHHSTKFQRAFNKYGWNNFILTYNMVEVEDENALKRLEIETIAKFDSYNNGYNETKGGDGHSILFDFPTRCTIYQLVHKYSGIQRKMAEKLKCDATVIAGIKNNDIYNVDNYDQKLLEQWEKELNLSETDLAENYIPHNNRKLTKQQVFEFCSVVFTEEGYAKMLVREFGVGNTIAHRLQHKMIYKDYIDEYEQLPKYEQKQLYEDTMKKYDLYAKKSQLNRHGDSLTQEQVDYILDNQNNKKRVEIAKDLGVSSDRVGNVILGKSYKDLVKNYYARYPEKDCRD